MIQTLTTIDGRLALMLDPAMLDRLQIDGRTSLEVTTEGNRLVVVPVKHAAWLAEVGRRVMDSHGAILEKLAQ